MVIYVGFELFEEELDDEDDDEDDDDSDEDDSGVDLELVCECFIEFCE